MPWPLLLRECKFGLAGYLGLDGGKAPAVAVVGEFDPACDLGEERIVGADAYIDAGLDARAALAHDDRAAGNQLATKGLYSQPLCV